MIIHQVQEIFMNGRLAQADERAVGGPEIIREHVGAARMDDADELELSVRGGSGTCT